jgi:nucleotide-binding universal stress UspA family protein
VSEAPLYPKVVAGYAPTEWGEDARVLGERVVAADGGELELVEVERGSPAHVLREMAEQGMADLIVLGSTPHAAIGSVAPGSVAEQLLKGAKCRLLIAPRGFARARAVRDAQERGESLHPQPGDAELPYVRDELRVVAVGFNGSAEARVALDEATKLALRFGATIRVIAACEPGPAAVGPPEGPPPAEIAAGGVQTRLLETVAQLPPEVRAQPMFERGDPVEQLLEHAKEGVDLLVLGSRGFGPVLRAMLGSVSARVIRRAPCSVMVVPRPPEVR